MLKWVIKANIFHLITDPMIDIVVSVDCDTLFAQPGCAGGVYIVYYICFSSSFFINSSINFPSILPLTELMSSLNNWQETDPALKVTTISENKNGEIIDVSLGTFAVHRQYSKEALFIWNKYITMKQPNFIKAMKDHVAKLPAGATNHMTVGHLIRRGPIDPATNEPLHPPTTWEKMDIYHQLSCINHISRSTCDAFGRDNVQAFIMRYNLESYDENVKYCHHWLTDLWLRQSWFPFHVVLPWCPKVG